MNDPLRVRILGTGSWVPDEVLDNEFFSSYLDTSDEWIVTRSGIHTRRRLAEGESTLTLALEASRRALDASGVTADELDLIIVCTVTPDTPLPATACWLQDALGVAHRGATSFDLGAACSGFVYGMLTAAALVTSGGYRRALVVGAEGLTRIVDYQDRTTCVLFGDGAGAVVMAPSDSADSGILYHEVGADGSKAKAVWVPAGGSREPASHRTVNERLHSMRMHGRELFKAAVLKMEELVDRTLQSTGTSAEDLRLVIPHQSNARIIESARRRMGLPPEKVAVNIDRFGNTSAASIPLAFDEACRNGTLSTGDLVLFLAFGAGVTWGSLLMRL